MGVSWIHIALVLKFPLKSKKEDIKDLKMLSFVTPMFETHRFSYIEVCRNCNLP